MGRNGGRVVRLVAGVALTSAAVGCASESDTSLTTSSATQARMLILDAPAPDYAIEGAFDLDQQPWAALSVVLFGDPGADDPFAAHDLAIWTSPEPGAIGAEEYYDDERDRTTIRDGTEAFIEPSEDGIDVVSWTERPDLGIAVVSHSLSADALIPIAEALDVNSEGSVTPAALPGGFEEVRSITGDLVSGEDWSVVIPADAAGLAVRYHAAEEELDPFDVVTFGVQDAASVDDLVIYFRYLWPEAVRTEAGGREVWLHQSEDMAIGLRVESPTTVTLISIDDPVAEPIELIEGLRPATPDEIDELLGEGERHEEEERQAEIPFVEGTTEGGYAWEMTGDTDGSVCLTIYSDADRGSFSSNCATVHTEDPQDDGLPGPSDITEPRARDEADSGELVFGVTPDDAEAVDVVLEVGAPIEARLHPADDLTAYVAEVPAGSEAVEVVFRDDGGDELYRESLD